MKRPFSSTLPFLLMAAGAATAFGLEPIAVLKPSDVPEWYARGFASSVAISGDYIAVGDQNAPWYNGDWTGAVYVFRRIGPRWVEQARLTASEPVYQGQLGSSVAIDRDTIVAGAPAPEFTACDFRREGTVVVFCRDDMGTPDDPSDDVWTQEAELKAPDPLHGRGLGTAVAISGDTLVAGSDCGQSAEVFRRNGRTWSHEASLQVNDALGFGNAVDIDALAQRILVGAPWGGHGAAYIFLHGSAGWAQEEELLPSSTFRVGWFGQAVSVHEGIALIGAPGSGWGPSAGAGYLFDTPEGGLWSQQTALTVSNSIENGELGIEFGLDVALDRDLALVARNGRPWAYLFEHACGNEWVLKDKLFSDTDPWLSIALHDRFAAIAQNIYVVRERKSLSHFSRFQNCTSTASVLPQQCRRFDLIANGRVGLNDFSEFLATFGGP